MHARRELAVAALGLVACVLGFRGEATIFGDHDLVGVRTVEIDIPSTPLTINGCNAESATSCPERLRYTGRILATGGTARDARAHARQVALVFEREGPLAALRAETPLSIRGLIDVELDAVELPSDRDLSVTTTIGDVAVTGVAGYVAVDVGIGDVSVDGGDAGIAVIVDDGEVMLRARGHASVDSTRGDVTVHELAGIRDVEVLADDGEVGLRLTSAADTAFDIAAGGPIRITTDTVVVLTQRRYARAVGAASTRVRVKAGGQVTIEQH